MIKIPQLHLKIFHIQFCGSYIGTLMNRNKTVSSVVLQYLAKSGAATYSSQLIFTLLSLATGRIRSFNYVPYLKLDMRFFVILRVLFVARSTCLGQGL